jgi:molybdenum cofactor cytidylyltransferase
MPAEIRGLLLCGGSSTRFGSDKLLVVIDSDHPGVGRGPISAAIVVHAARNLIAGAGRALAIIPPKAGPLRKMLEDAGCEILESSRTARGLGASLAAGVAASANADGWIVALGDMPFIRPDTIAAVRAKLEGGAAIVAPVLVATGERGHPVGFARALKDELAALDGDEGARAVIARHRDGLVTIPVDDPGIVVDIDTPGDLQEARR